MILRWFRKQSLFLYTLFIVALFFSLMIWMTPSGRGDQHSKSVNKPIEKQLLGDFSAK